MKITFIGHACFLIEDNAGHTIATDPYRHGAVPGLKDHDLVADEVICSHNHHDHDDFDGVGAPENTWPGKFDVKIIRTFHDDVQGAARGRNNISIINIDGKKVVHMGDIGCELSASQLDQIRGCDVLMIPVGGFYTINARQAFAMTKDIDPRVVIPMHYRGKTFGYKEIATREEFEQLVLAKGDRKVIRHTSVFEDNNDYKCMVLLEPLRA